MARQKTKNTKTNVSVPPIPRPEYPRPQFVREQWLCLNGEWQFEIDAGDSGEERGLKTHDLTGTIIVPFCPESELSGVGNTDFMQAVWYRREVTIPGDWGDKNVLLHFQACDYDTTVWICLADGDCREVVRHRGGFTPFSANLEGIAKAGDTITIVVRARDYFQPPQPRGKQSQRYANYECLYTRTTGIWQTVWMEPVPRCYLRRSRITPYVAHDIVRIEQPIVGPRAGLTLRATLSDDKGVVAVNESHADEDLMPYIALVVPQDRSRLWSVEDPFLYDLLIELIDEQDNVVDKLQSYTGLRAITIEGKAVKINGRSIFQRLVLDQGYYPDGIMTAPTEQALIDDIRISQEAGFNGARLHQKIFEERFLYHCDKMGYLVWAEFPDWGLRGIDDNILQPGITNAAQWTECVQRDYSHPSIVGWCPLNETYEEIRSQISLLDDATHAMFWGTKAVDHTRPVLDASGYSHRIPETDIYDCHDYTQDPKKFVENHAGLAQGQPYYNGPKDKPWNIHYRGQPFFVSEFGGIWWRPGTTETSSWGYGERPKTIKEFYDRFDGLCSALLDNEHMFGYCYTQLTDVYQEENGIYSFDRTPKFDIARIHAVQARPAAIELLEGPQAIVNKPVASTKKTDKKAVKSKKKK
jgi:beta-galactosidase/beta-glucuronidase